jgi:hypothetical protein
MDYLRGFAGILPWRCESCEARFYARAMALRCFLYAHCRICGNFDLQHISAERMQGILAIPWRIMGIPALRCDPCRHKFFSIRPLRSEARTAAGAPGK